MEFDQDFINRIIEGETDLFRYVVEEYKNLVFSISFNVIKDNFEAENIAQETFIATYSSLASFKGGNFKVWICRIATNKALDFRKKRIRTLNKEVDYEDLSYEIPDEDNSEKALETKEDIMKLRKIADGLPEKYRRIIEERYFLELSLSEISQRNNLKAKTVETRLYRAKKLIKERWGEDDFG